MSTPVELAKNSAGLLDHPEGPGACGVAKSIGCQDVALSGILLLRCHRQLDFRAAIETLFQDERTTESDATTPHVLAGSEGFAKLAAKSKLGSVVKGVERTR